jgi:hypothetical protein
MLEGLAQSYLEALSGGWQPRDAYVRPIRDSQCSRRALGSLPDMRGERHESVPDTCSGLAGNRT